MGGKLLVLAELSFYQKIELICISLSEAETFSLQVPESGIQKIGQMALMSYPEIKFLTKSRSRTLVNAILVSRSSLAKKQVEIDLAFSNSNVIQSASWWIVGGGI